MHKYRCQVNVPGVPSVAVYARSPSDAVDVAVNILYEQGYQPFGVWDITQLD